MVKYAYHCYGEFYRKPTIPSNIQSELIIIQFIFLFRKHPKLLSIHCSYKRTEFIRRQSGRVRIHVFFSSLHFLFFTFSLCFYVLECFHFGCHVGLLRIWRETKVYKTMRVRVNHRPKHTLYVYVLSIVLPNVKKKKLTHSHTHYNNNNKKNVRFVMCVAISFSLIHLYPLLFSAIIIIIYLFIVFTHWLWHIDKTTRFIHIKLPKNEMLSHTRTHML